MSLSKRQSQILQVLKNSSYEVSGNDLANLLNVTSRTIRNEIKNINSLLEVKCIQSNSQGYFLDCSSEDWMKLIDVEDENIKNQLLRIVLANEVALNVDGLCEQFYMSRKRFMLILDSLKPIMQEFNLTFKVEMNRLYIIGSEFNKRALILSLIYREANNDIANIQTISLFFSDINLNELKTLVDGIVKKYSYYIKLYNDLLNAKNGLDEAEKVEGEETGVLDEWTEKKVGESTKIRGGQLYVSNETTNNDGTTTITVTWVNDGTYPLTGGYFHNINTTTSGKFGGEYTLRPYKESDFRRAGDPFIDVHYTNLNGEHKTISEDLTVDAVVDGFVKEFTVPTGSSISLEISNWGNDFYSYSLGTYYTKNVVAADTTAPTVELSYEMTEEGVKVTLTANEAIQSIDGWTKVSDTKYTKLYTENTSEDIIVYDLAGNATKAHVTVSSISKPGTGGSDQDKNQGTDTKKEDSKKTDGTNTGVFVGTGLFVGSAAAAAAGASLLAFLKKRKK